MFRSLPSGLMMKLPRRSSPVFSSYTPNIRDTFPVGSAPIWYFTLASSFSLRCQARWENCVSVLAGTMSQPIRSNRSQSSELGRSDEREVGGVKEEDGPPLAGDLVPQAELAEIPLDGVVGGELEVGNDLSQPEPGAGIGHTDRPPVWFHLVDCLIAPDAARDFFHRT